MHVRHAITWINSRAALMAASDRGASLVEYALLVALIAVVCIVAMGFLGTSASTSYSRSTSSMFIGP